METKSMEVCAQGAASQKMAQVRIEFKRHHTDALTWERGMQLLKLYHDLCVTESVILHIAVGLNYTVESVARFYERSLYQR